ncbi:MAG: hypothetical protein F4Y67_01025 [Chloroflexi bacterium]|nr:hypothetical protein [Chloroflexota bacterium]
MGYVIGGLVLFLVLAANVGLGWAIAIIATGFVAILGIGFVAMAVGWDPDPKQNHRSTGPRHIGPRFKPKRRGFSSVRRQRTFASLRRRDGGNCGICGHRLGSTADTHIDHIRPVSKGGGNELANLRLTHARCNLRRGNRG